MIGYHRGESTAQIRRYVMRGALGLHGVAKYLGAALPRAVGGFMSSSALDAFEDLEHIGSAQLGDGT